MPLTGKDANEIASLKERLLAEAPADGASIGNKALRERLGWETDLYLAVRGRLIDDGLLTLGKGRGGSVRRWSCPYLTGHAGRLEGLPELARRAHVEP